MPSSKSDSAVELALQLANDLPYADLMKIATALQAGRRAGKKLRQDTGSVALRDAITRLLDVRDQSRACGALQAAATAAERTRQQSIDLVWTGPASAVATSRLTWPVVTDLLSSARQEILLVGYAVQESAGVTEGLVAAADRGVQVTLLLERHEDNPGFTQHGDPLAGVPARRLHWPASKRDAHASLHAKVLVVDRRAALVGSANLTGAALERNLECGLLLRGGPHPEQVCRHVESLLANGVIRQLTDG